MSLTSPALEGGFFTTSATWETPEVTHIIQEQVSQKRESYFLLLVMTACSVSQDFEVWVLF